MNEESTTTPTPNDGIIKTKRNDPADLAAVWQRLYDTDRSDYHDKGVTYTTIAPPVWLIKHTIKALETAWATEAERTKRDRTMADDAKVLLDYQIAALEAHQLNDTLSELRTQIEAKIDEQLRLASQDEDRERGKPPTPVDLPQFFRGTQNGLAVAKDLVKEAIDSAEAKIKGAGNPK